MNDKFFRLLGLIVLLLFLAAPACAADAIKLAEESKALAKIEIGPEASLATRSVALELAEYLERISGAPFEVVQTPGDAPRIYLGRADEFPQLNYGERLRDKAPETFLMRTEAGNVLLLGVTDVAASHAAYTFLERLGVRWFFPTEEWEIVPSKSTLTINLDEEQSPDMKLHRSMWYGTLNGSFTAQHLRTDWMRRNRMKLDGPVTSHSWVGLDPDKDFKEHPEWFAEVKGERRPSKPNYGHPDVVKRAVEYAVATAKTGADSVTVSAPDGLDFCTCDQCLKVAGVERDAVFDHNHAIFGKRPDGKVVCVTSETIFRMANEAARAVAKVNPKTLVGVFAYSGYAHPPSFDLEPNVYVAVTSLYRRTPLPYDEQVKIYATKTKQMGVYEYYHIAVFYGAHPSKGAKMSDLEKWMKFYRANHVLGVNAESTNNWLPAGLDFYVASKLMWDVDADVDMLYADFLDKAFGKAKGPMKSYYDRWESKAEMNVATIGGALNDLITAYRIADSEAVKTRIAQLYLYNRFLHRELKLQDVEGDKEMVKQAGAEYADLFWRLKDTQLMHDLLTRGVHRPLIPGFTAEEIENSMREDQKWLDANRNLFATYSRHFVPLATAGKEIPGLKEQPISAGQFRHAQLLIPAKAGETINVEVQPHEGRGPAAYRITFTSTEEFESGAGAGVAEIVESGESSGKISFKAAQAGYYRVFIDNIAGLASVSHPYILDGGDQSLDNATFYFYVPKGTKQFTISANAYAGPTLRVKDAEGNLVFAQDGFSAKKLGMENVFKADIDVPPGTDGSVWSVEGPGDVNATSSVRLDGVPEYFSLSPHQLLVAEEYLK